jgi:outer membrane protein TolC
LDRANLTALSLNNTFQSTVRSLELAKLTLQNAQSTLEDNQKRQDAGLVIGLEVDQAVLAVKQAELGILSAHIEVLKAILSTYKTYAQPSSETLSPSEDSQ